jgi:hypothetical protein
MESGLFTVAHWSLAARLLAAAALSGMAWALLAGVIG